MAYNSRQKQSFEARTVTAGTSTTYRLGSQYCPDNGWLVAWSCDQARQLTVKMIASVGGEGSLSSTIVETADMSRHGLVGVPWPVLSLTVTCDTVDTEITLHAYAVDNASGTGGWPSRLYRTITKNINAAATHTETIPKGASDWMVTGSDDYDVDLLDGSGNTILKFAVQKGNVTTGNVSADPWRSTIEGGSIKVTNNAAGAADLTFWFRYNLADGSGLA